MSGSHVIWPVSVQESAEEQTTANHVKEDFIYGITHGFICSKGRK